MSAKYCRMLLPLLVQTTNKQTKTRELNASLTNPKGHELPHLILLLEWEVRFPRYVLPHLDETTSSDHCKGVLVVMSFLDGIAVHMRLLLLRKNVSEVQTTQV